MTEFMISLWRAFRRPAVDGYQLNQQAFPKKPRERENPHPYFLLFDAFISVGIV